MGYQTRIYAESIVPPLDKKTALAISELKDVSNDDIIIFHMSTGSHLNFDVAKYPCRKIVVYHNITPPEYFKNNDERFSDICEYGLKGAKSLADKVDYCLAVSEFNKRICLIWVINALLMYFQLLYQCLIMIKHQTNQL